MLSIEGDFTVSNSHQLSFMTGASHQSILMRGDSGQFPEECPWRRVSTIKEAGMAQCLGEDVPIDGPS